MAVAVDGVREAVRAVRKRFGELGAHKLARALQQLCQGVVNDIGAEARNDLADALHAKFDAADESAEIAAALVWKARVAVEDRQCGLVGHPRIDELRRRDDDAFLVDVGRVGADRAGPDAADVGEMRPAHHKRATSAVVEDGCDQHLVVGVGDGAA